MSTSNKNIESNDDKPESKGIKAWIKRLGWFAVIFFTLKGLAWLIFGATIIELFRGCNQ